MLGLLDDVLIVPAGIWLVLRIIPEPLMAEFRTRAGELADKPRSTAGLVFVLAIWLAAAAALGMLLVP
ncbi:hypothetical protein [Qipengyuania aurantiaca]|uniref:hypothetical protein n=1 Tax=Qipengyuania aurantiaca TaxID=2867233 RepID=UPI003CD0C9B1